MKKVVFKLKFYTDGDWSYNIDDFKNDHSRYFEDDLYEYTSIDYHSMSMRRVYDMFEIDKLISMLYKIKSNLHSRDEHNYKVITDFMDEIIENIKDSVDIIKIIKPIYNLKGTSREEKLYCLTENKK